MEKKNLPHRSIGMNRFLRGVLTGLLLCLGYWGILNASVHAGDALPQKKQEVTQFGEIEVSALDQKNWNRPQGMFSWIAMSCGWKVPDDTYGRTGWFRDARIRPVDPGVSRFSQQQQEIYVVFEIPSLDAPMQMNADWFRLDEKGKTVGKALGQDSQFMDMNEGYGYLEIRPSEQGWALGQYLVKIYISSPGQQIHALSQVGTMQFTIAAEEEGQACQVASRQ